MAAHQTLVAAARQELAAHANPANAPAMQAYMKSAMPYRGVKTPELRALCRELFAAQPIADFETWRDTILALYREAQFREERYVALELASASRYRAFRRQLKALQLYEELIVTGAWWDLVDGVAESLVGGLLHDHPAEMRPIILDWSRSPDMWKRRSAIISQLHFKRETDLALLYACIEPNLAERAFFIRKAIGWALRQYAWIDPAEVQRYVAEHEPQLSGLSKREALKNVARLAASA